MRRATASAVKRATYRSAEAAERQDPLPVALAGCRERAVVGRLVSAETGADYTGFFDQRAFAAFRAMAFLLRAGSAAARAFPPVRPPFLPMAAR